MESNKGEPSPGSASVSTALDLIDGKVEEKELFGFRHCPGCGHKLHGPKPDWVGLPAGVKFDPTDQELMEHLEAKVQAQGRLGKSHPLIDEFIPTIQGDDGICYTHPEKLPRVSRDGLSRHFFHRPSKAYTTGTRKRRKIHTECDLQGGETRWHKTGKTRPVLLNGNQKGCKKILVLYTNFGKNRKPEKTNWVMHQYHLGHHEEEREGQLVVSKIFYQTQPRQCNWLERTVIATSVGPGEGSQASIGGESVSSKEAVDLTSQHHHQHQHQHQHQQQRHHHLVGDIAAMANYSCALEIHQQLKGSDPFAYVPSEAGRDEGASSSMSAVDEQPHQQMAFHIRQPAHPISHMITPSPLHHASIMLDHHHHDSFHVPPIILPNQSFQQHQAQQQTEQHHHKIGGRSASGLEEIIMGCTSSLSSDVKEESSMRNPQEAEWLIKYSSSGFWHDDPQSSS